MNEVELSLQFIISEHRANTLNNFKPIQCNGLNVSMHQKLRSCQVFGPSGSQIGLFLGTPIDLNKEQIIDTDVHLHEDFDDVPSFLESYAGSYIFLFVSNGEKRIYLDANGTMSLVFDAATRQAGSTAAVLLDQQSYFERLRRVQFERLDILNFGWFPSGLTAHEGIDRLLCNHYLDLNTWQPIRFWPQKKIDYSTTPRTEVTSIRQETTKLINALTKSHNVIQSLTAGYETRFLLSCAREHVSKISFFTIISTKIDTDIAKKLSSEFSLSYTPIPVSKANTRQQQEWLYRAGHTVGGTNLLTHPSINNFPPNTVLSIGLGGEVGRGFFWKKNDHANTGITAELIVGRFGLPYDKLVLERTEHWLAGLPPDLDFFTILDLVYLELRMSAWAYAQSYAQDSICPHFSPMISYRNYKSMFQIHPDRKKSDYIIRQSILDGWPELLKYPINRYGGVKDIFTIINKLSNPKRITAKVRKMFSG